MDQLSTSRLTGLTRRELLRATLLSSGAVLAGFESLAWLRPAFAAQVRSPNAGQFLGNVPFIREGPLPLDTLVGEELDARLYTDLSKLDPGKLIVPTSRYYMRTAASHLLDSTKPWTIRLTGFDGLNSLSPDELARDATSMGAHVMECAGNTREGDFGLISAAEWRGVPISKFLDRAAPGGVSDGTANAAANRVLVSGFDSYATKSISSIPGASWIFTQDDLPRAGAFLATEMNGAPLTRDHGAPVRLIVPGWYGCTCIKWVNEVSIVGEDSEATSQMQEFAFRTHQNGVPKLARDYEPAVMDQAAMPVRVEKWRVNQKIRYRVVGILWGGSQPVERLEIRFNPEEDYVPVQGVYMTSKDPWTLWTHEWTPSRAGVYLIRLRVAAPAVRTRRLDTGFYVRAVQIMET